MLFRIVSKPFKSLLQHYNLKASVLQLSAFFMIQLSYPYVTTEKVLALTVWTFVSKMMSLFFNVLSMLVIAFLPRSKHLFFSWLQQPSTVILETPPKIKKNVNVPTLPPSFCHEVMGPDAMILIFWMLSFKPAISLSSFILIEILFNQVLFHVISLYILFLNLIRETLQNVLWKSRLITSTEKEARLLVYDLCLVNAQEVLPLWQALTSQLFNNYSRIMSWN